MGHRYLDTVVSVTPDFEGLPPNILNGLHHLTNNAAAVLTIVSSLGIAVSLIGLVLGTWSQNPQLTERSRGGFVVSVGAIALLFVGVATANYAARLFQ